MKFEDFCIDNKCLLMGEEYLKSLQDGWEIYIYGECVKDVMIYLVFCNVVVFVV